MASRDIHDERLYRISSELELAKQKISNLEVTEYQIIDKLKQSINEHSFLLEKSRSYSFNDLRQIAHKSRLSRSSQEWKP
jgi:hypothetical protein